MNHRLASDVCRESPSYARSAKYNSWAKLAAFKEWTGEYQPAGFLVKFSFPASPSYFVLVYAPGVVFTLHSLFFQAQIYGHVYTRNSQRCWIQ